MIFIVDKHIARVLEGEIFRGWIGKFYDRKIRTSLVASGFEHGNFHLVQGEPGNEDRIRKVVRFISHLICWMLKTRADTRAKLNVLFLLRGVSEAVTTGSMDTLIKKEEQEVSKIRDGS